MNILNLLNAHCLSHLFSWLLEQVERDNKTFVAFREVMFVYSIRGDSLNIVSVHQCLLDWLVMQENVWIIYGGWHHNSSWRLR